MANISGSNLPSSTLRMTKDKELNLLLQIPPPYYYTAIEISSDKRYWNDDDNRDKYLPFFSVTAIEGHKRLHTFANLYKPEIMINIFRETGLFSFNTDSERIKKAVDIFQAYVDAETDRTWERKAQEQQKQWENSPYKTEKEKEIANLEKARQLHNSTKAQEAVK